MKSFTHPRKQSLFITSKPTHSHGLTLIELLITMSIMMIVISLGSSTLPSFIHKQTTTTALNTLFHLVTFTRTKAIREQEVFTLCASNDDRNCTGEWNKKIIIFNDNNKNARRDNTETLFKTISMPANTPCLKWNAGLNRQYLRFKPDGSNAGTAGHFKFCNPNPPSIQKKIVISFTGRTSFRNL